MVFSASKKRNSSLGKCPLRSSVCFVPIHILALYLWVSLTLKPLFWYKHVNIIIFSPTIFEIFKYIFFNFSKPSRKTVDNFFPGIADHMKKLWTKNHLDSSYFPLKKWVKNITFTYFLHFRWFCCHIKYFKVHFQFLQPQKSLFWYKTWTYYFYYFFQFFLIFS